jgi:23S rRNA pseudouridine1911/1915/1917 synthase
VFVVKPEDAGSRLDTFLAHHLEKTSRALVQRWIRGGSVTVGGKQCKASHLLVEAETIEVTPISTAQPELTAEPIPIEIIYEDDDLVVVNKSAGIVVHPGAGNWSGTLANALLHHFSQLSGRDPVRPGIVHRLDKETSGIMIVAKNEFIHESLSRQFRKREVEKHYLALLYGELKPTSGTIEVPIGRDPYARTKISARSARPRAALTRYEVLQLLPGFTYVRAIPRTGRTHQIRVHFHHIGFPVVGDKSYGHRKIADTRKANAIRAVDRHFLHATFLRITHPTTGKQVEFNAPLPDELEELLITLGK